ncbi:glucuronate isomerase [Actinobacillus equuli]|nr:glucuronate isomerase [Actinobacillus equuli]
MERQLQQLSQLGLLSQFVGMLTDSRSFLSYTRHEYFRRILCEMIGTWVVKGEAPNDIELLGNMLKTFVTIMQKLFQIIGKKMKKLALLGSV